MKDKRFSIFVLRKRKRVIPVGPRQSENVLRITLIGQNGKKALIYEWTKFMTVFEAADIISREEFDEYKKSADYKGLIPVRWVNVVKYQWRP